MTTAIEPRVPYPTADQLWRAYQNHECSADIAARENQTAPKRGHSRMTTLSTSKEMTSSASIWGSHVPDSSASIGPIADCYRASDDELLAAARRSDGRAFAELCHR